MQSPRAVEGSLSQLGERGHYHWFCIGELHENSLKVFIEYLKKDLYTTMLYNTNGTKSNTP